MNPKSNFTFQDMRQTRYLLDAGIQVLVPIFVILIFKLIPERKTAALIAGFLFCLVPLILGYREYRFQRFRNILMWSGLLQFLLFFALPIFVGRIIFWDMDFETIKIGGIFLAQMHKVANFSYAIMLLASIISIIIPRRL